MSTHHHHRNVCEAHDNVRGRLLDVSDHHPLSLTLSPLFAIAFITRSREQFADYKYLAITPAVLILKFYRVNFWTITATVHLLYPSYPANVVTTDVFSDFVSVWMCWVCRKCTHYLDGHNARIRMMIYGYHWFLRFTMDSCSTCIFILNIKCLEICRIVYWLFWMI